MRVLKAIVAVALLIYMGACDDILEVPDISGERVELLAPSDSTIVVQNNVQFNWNGIYEATEYHIQIATPNFENASQIVLDSIISIDSTFIGTQVNKTLVDNDYEWRVRASNSDYQTGFTASTFTVETSN